MIPPKEQMVMARDFVVRRTELTVPGHSLKMMAKAATSNADQVMFDLEDACAVSQKVEARKVVVEALNTLDFKGKIRAFRPNNIRTRYFYRDLIEVVESAGSNIDVVVIPKCYGSEDILFVDRFLTQIEENMGFEGKWAIHPAQIEIINEAFTRTDEEIAKAKHTVDEYEKADVQGGLGAIVIDDQMIDAALLRVEWRKLAIARRAGLA